MAHPLARQVEHNLFQEKDPILDCTPATLAAQLLALNCVVMVVPRLFRPLVRLAWIVLIPCCYNIQGIFNIGGGCNIRRRGLHL